MPSFDEQLEQLKARITRFCSIDLQIKTLSEQRLALDERIPDLSSRHKQAQREIAALEGISLARIWAWICGDLEKKCVAAHEEEQKTAKEYVAARKSLCEVEQKLDQLRKEACDLRGCKERYAELLKEKKAAILEAGGDASVQIILQEDRVLRCERKIREIKEAQNAGQRAVCLAVKALEELDSAKSYATWDMMGGGMLADMAKHGHLRDAQGHIEELKLELARFKSELEDVEISVDIRASIDGFLHFADYFFDGLLVDWAVMDRIKCTYGQLIQTQGTIGRIMSRLDILRVQAEEEKRGAQERIEQIVRHTPM